MKTKIWAIISCLFLLLVFVNDSLGCGSPPVAVLTAVPSELVVGEVVTLDGSSSSDSDGTIVECSWDWTNNGSYDYTENIPPGDKKAQYAYSSPGTYTAKLRVKDNDGLYDYDTCTITVTLPAAPTLVSPSNGSKCQSIDGVTLSWSTVSGADSYKVHFGTNTTPPCVNDVNTNSYSTGTLEPYTRYYWKIKTYQNGYTSEDSELWYFTTCSLMPGQATNPRQVELDGDIIISWIGDANAASHDIYFGTDPNNLQFQTNQTTTSYNLGTLEPDAYYWRIDEVSRCGCTVTAGEVWNFTIHDIWYVNNAVSGGLNNGTSWANAFYDLQSALDVVDPNEDVIWVAKGWEGYYPSKETISGDGRSATFQLISGLRIYGGFDGTESYLSQRDLVNNVTILSGNREDLDDTSDNCYHVVTCQEVNDVILDGITIKNGYATGSDSNSNGAGLYCDNSTITLKKCVIAENIANSNGGGIYCEDSNIVLTDCVVIENEADKGGGIYDFNSSPIVTNCTFSENSVSDDGGGIYNYSPSSEPNVSNSIFWGNSAADLGNQIYNNSADPNFRYCNIEDSNGSGAGWVTSLGDDDGGNIDYDPCFMNIFDFSDETTANGTTTTIKVADGNLYEVNDIIEYGYDSMVRTVTDVNTTTDIITFADDALDANSTSGVSVHNWGKDANDLDRDYRLSEVSACINTGDPNGDYDGQYDADDQTREKAERIDMGAYEASWTVHNTSKGSWGKWYDSIQEAIDDANNTNEIIAYPATYYETIDFNDMAITLRGMDPNDSNNIAATVIDANCDPYDSNTYACVVTFDDGEDSNSVLMGFTITGGFAPGSTSDPNNGGGIYCNNSSPTISNCIISDNTAIGLGGGIYDCNSSSPVITNCIFSENDANNGGGMYNLDSLPTLTNCTFVGNNASDCGGGVYDSNSDAIIKNSILYYNSAYSSGDQIYNDSSDPNISYSNIKGCKDSNDAWDPNFGLNGGGNTRYAPYFVDIGGYSYFEDTDNRDYHLLTYSSCIDTGDPCSSYAYEPNDPNNTRINMGAYGNTPQAELASEDGDSDNLPDDWELVYWPYDDPNLHDPNDDLDTDDVNNLQEYHIGTDPNNSDTDDDGMPDGWEYEYNLEPLDADDAFEDGDNDDLTNLGEYEYGTEPDNNDTDADQMPDGWEVDNYLNPVDANDVNDDDDGDNLTNLQEYNAGTDPNDSDSDDDGMPDDWEIDNYLAPTDPNTADEDLDGDGYTNLSEYLHSSDPNDNTSVPSSNVTIDVTGGAFTIQSAIYASIDGDTIELDPGTYYEAIDFNGKAITLTGTDPNDWDIVESTIIDGEGASAVVKFEHSEEANSILEGITVTGGGRGIYINLFCSPTISNCVIRDNDDTGTFLFLSDPNISNCVFKSNSGIFGGGIYNLRSSPKITNCIFSQNTATTLGGGICNQILSKPIITNCTFSENTASSYGGGIYNNASSSPVITNSIFWSNTASTSGGEIYNYDENSDPNFSYCDIEGEINKTKCGGYNSIDGGGNINSDPNFIDANNSDYHLTAGSPCINTGDPCGDYTGQFDIDGEPRELLGRVDIGAYEYGPVHNKTADLWYETIQDALDDANDNDIIEVKQGTYRENIDFNGVSCTVQSTDPNDWEIATATIIDANDPNAAVVKFETSEDINSVLKGFTITGGDPGIYCDGSSPTISNCVITDNNSSSLGGGMYDVNSSPTVTNCFFINNDANDGGGIYDYNSSPTLINCVFSNNLGREDGGGMYNYDSSPTLVNCTFSNNDANNGGGMYNYGNSSEPNVSNSIFWGNVAADSGNQVYNNSADPNFRYCDIEDSNNGGSWDTNLGTNGGNNIDSDPYFADANDHEGSDGLLGTYDDGLVTSFYSPCKDMGSYEMIPNDVNVDIKGDNRIENTVDMGAYEYTGPDIICVDVDANGSNDGTSWTNAYTDLQSALDVADPNTQEIWVADGTYKPTDTNDRTISFELIEGLALYGGFEGNELFRDQRDWSKNETVLSGDIGSSPYYTDNSYHVVIGADDAILDGFTVEWGYARDVISLPKGATRLPNILFGGGIYCDNASPSIKNCKIQYNYALESGSGMYNHRSKPTLTNCTFVNNIGWYFIHGSGITSEAGSHPTLIGCTFETNYRGAIYSKNSDLTLTDCIVYDNRRDGLFLCGNSNAVLTNCTFSQNKGGFIGGAIGIGNISNDNVNINIALTNCIFSENVASYGGGIYGGVAKLTLVNCIFTENSARKYGGGIMADNLLEMTNCTFSGNSASISGGGIYYDVYDFDQNDLMLTNCILWNNSDSGGTDQSAQISSHYHGTPAVDYSCIQGWTGSWGGTGNIGNDPCFANASNPDGQDHIWGTFDDGLQLVVGSPCVDAADGDSAPSRDILDLMRVDIAGASNIGTGNPNYTDMGAYESYDGLDSDFDGMTNDWEEQYGLNPYDARDANMDPDSDELSNLEEYNNSTNPNDNDTDDDEMPDGWEINNGLDPHIDEANDDNDNDGLTNLEEYNLGTNPNNNDTDGDEMPDKWESDNYLNPADVNDANDDLDSDGFINIVEYWFGYDPNVVTNEPFQVGSNISEWSNFDSDVNYSQIDPTTGQSLNIEYWLNMDANVIVTFKNTDTGVAVRTIDEGYKTAGWYELQWDCTDNDSNLVERYFYDVNIAGDTGDGNTANWQSPDGSNTSYYDRSTNRIRVYTSDFDAYKNIPVDIRCDMLDFAKRTIDVVEDDNPSSSINTVVNDRLLEPGWNSFDWYGYWDNGVSNGDLCEQAFDVYFDIPTGVNRGSVLVYYDSLLSDLRCNPYRILALSDEAATISYDLAYDSDVTITITDPCDNSFVLVDSQSQLASQNPQEITLHGTSDPGDPNSVYLSNEGVYRIEVEVENDNITEKLEGSITVYR